MSNNNFCTSWIEVSRKALRANCKTILSVIDKKITPSLCVKGNAYGHDARLIAKEISHFAPHAWLNVHSLEDAAQLRSSAITTPILIMGPLLKQYIEFAIRFDTRFVVYDESTLRTANEEARKQKKTANVHLKIETGTHRQGVEVQEALRLLTVAKTLKYLHVEGVSTHFANIEDIPLRTFVLQGYPAQQLDIFKKTVSVCEQAGHSFEKIHCANSAATLLFKETHGTMVRPGVSLYGMWPSPTTKTLFERMYPHKTLLPVLSWKTRIGQIKTIEKGKYIGYGCTYKTTRKTKVAVLPIGYYDGYARSMSNRSHVMIHGKKAPLRGRVFMNMLVVDCTNIPEAQLEDEVTLLGGGIDVDDFARWGDTINYDATTRIRESIPRCLIS